jgi:hypothetical protein
MWILSPFRSKLTETLYWYLEERVTDLQYRSTAEEALMHFDNSPGGSR